MISHQNSLVCRLGAAVGAWLVRRTDGRMPVTVRRKYACPACKGGVTQVQSPPRLIEGAPRAEGTIAAGHPASQIDNQTTWACNQVST